MNSHISHFEFFTETQTYKVYFKRNRSAKNNSNFFLSFFFNWGVLECLNAWKQYNSKERMTGIGIWRFVI